MSPPMVGRRRHHDALGRRRARDSSGRGEVQGAGVEEQGHRARADEQRDRHECHDDEQCERTVPSSLCRQPQRRTAPSPSDFTFLGPQREIQESPVQFNTPSGQSAGVSVEL
jgi:hypothetical protein